ncbi:MAG: type VI secretion system baseplate subunit TssE [Candidatus Competibacteraceae bacterium]|nr:type VI secretion system baseplate subunit TssE [Candidatus Competibacteraceae bacterium]
MAELTPKERLQPSLLDRLTDEEPDRQEESRDKRVLSMSRLRECVLRDLGWLLNATRMADDRLDARYPFAARSVINYGLPALAGGTARSLEINDLEQSLRQAIIDFEPRLLRHSLRVRAELTEERMSHNALTFEIEGSLWAQPLPLQLYLKTEIDLESGQVQIEESSQPRGR